MDNILLISAGRRPIVLEYRLRSLWPAAAFSAIKVENGRAAAPVAERVNVSGKTILIEWVGSRDQSPVDAIKGIEPVLLGLPQFYRQKDLKAYRVRTRPQSN